jgi:CRISPR system Cascade subunit CasA
MPNNAENGLNLLTERLLTLDSGEQVTLAGLFAGLARGTVDRLLRLRAHQRTAWHMFTVQLAALALDRAGRRGLPETADDWAELLRALSEAESGTHSDDPWRLVVADRTSPAFMQPPDPGGLKWSPVPTPDALDLLITSRNHDLKSEVAYPADPEDWVYALVSLQTMEGYGGKSNYGIARMNGGSSSRSFLGLIPAKENGTPDRAAWWRRDVELCLAHGDEDTPMTPGGAALLWCRNWAEGALLSVKDMDPLAVEICRRVRLIDAGAGLTAERAGSRSARVDAKAFHGVLGDPWAPVSRDTAAPKALTIGEGRFDYRRLVDLLLSGNWAVPLGARLREREPAARTLLLAEALARGNSKTDGLRSRLVPFPKKVVAGGWFGQSKKSLADAAAQQIDEIASADAALREAVALYAADGDPEVFIAKDKRQRAKAARQAAAPARACLDAASDAVFFDHLWDRADPATQSAARRAFRAVLVDGARCELEHAFAAIPCASVYAARARVRARARLVGRLHKAELIEPEPADA